RIKRAYLERHYRGVERAPFEHQDEPARFLGGAMVRELTESSSARACCARRGRFLPTSWRRPPFPTRSARSSGSRAGRPRRSSASIRSAIGIAGRSDRVALFPRSDRYEILRLMGTNGWNYDIGPDRIVAWLRALKRDHPFVLTGMGFDWVEGRFRSAIGDAGALARRVYVFCCWWD